MDDPHARCSYCSFTDAPDWLYTGICHVCLMQTQSTVSEYTLSVLLDSKTSRLCLNFMLHVKSKQRLSAVYSVSHNALLLNNSQCSCTVYARGNKAVDV